MEVIKLEKQTKESIEKFCENEFINEDIAEKLEGLLLGTESSIELVPIEGTNYVELKISMKLKED